MRIWPNALGRRLGRLSLIQRFLIATTIALILTLSLLGSWVIERITDGVIKNNAEAAALYMESFLEPHIQDLDATYTLTPAQFAQLEAMTARVVGQGHILSIKIWSPDGTIIFASQLDLIGQKFPPDELQGPLSGKIEGHLEDLTAEENTFERTLSQPLFEIYAPLRSTATGQVIAVGEFYQDATKLRAEIVASAKDSWLVSGAAGIGMLFMLFLIVNSGSQKISTQQVALSKLEEMHRSLSQSNSDLQNRIEIATQNITRLDERVQKRIGIELHDGPAQMLAFILMNIDEIEDLLAKVDQDDRPSRNVLHQVREAAQDALADLRTMSSGLFLNSEDSIGETENILDDVIALHESRTGVSVERQGIDAIKGVPDETMSTLAKLTREALSNGFLHGGGIGQKVTVTSEKGSLVLEVSDKGPGITPDTASPMDGERSHLGLKGMRFRIEAIGGTMDIRSAANAGTTVVFSVPVAPPTVSSAT